MTGQTPVLRALAVPGSMVDNTDPSTPRLLAGHCEGCRITAFPAPAQCPRCLRSPLPPRALPTEGILYSYSVVHVGPSGWPVPYTVGYVDLPGDVRVFAHVADTDESVLRPDLPVRLDLAAAGDGAYRATWRSREGAEVARA